MADYGPYNAIVVSAGIKDWQVRETLLGQLKFEGKLVVPEGVDYSGTGVLNVYTNWGRSIVMKRLGRVNFVLLK